MIETPYGYCKCGCGDLAPLAGRNEFRRGYVKGMPMEYIHGHSAATKRVHSVRYFEMDGEPVAAIMTQKGEILVDADMVPRLPKFITVIQGYPSWFDRSVCQLVRLHWFVMGRKNIDHENLDTFDNRRRNLRDADKSTNGANRNAPVNNTSGYKGVHWSRLRNVWISKITVRQVSIHLGCFSDKIKAAYAYDRAALKYFGGYARLNFPENKEMYLREIAA